jgi:hypothetical protein
VWLHEGAATGMEMLGRSREQEVREKGTEKLHVDLVHFWQTPSQKRPDKQFYLVVQLL